MIDKQNRANQGFHNSLFQEDVFSTNPCEMVRFWIQAFHLCGHEKFAFSAVLGHNSIERNIVIMRYWYSEPYCAGGLLDHCIVTEYM